MTKAKKLAGLFTLATLVSIVIDYYLILYPIEITQTLAIMATMWAVGGYLKGGDSA